MKLSRKVGYTLTDCTTQSTLFTNNVGYIIQQGADGAEYATSPKYLLNMGPKMMYIIMYKNRRHDL